LKISRKIKSSVPFRYAIDVRAGKIVCGPFVKMAVSRFWDWIENADSKGYFLDHGSGMHIILFFKTFIPHTKGEKANEPFELSPYQQFTLYNIFAWKKYNESGKPVRVIKTVYEKVARKNGKTAVLAALGLYCMAFDNESGPEIYVGATKEAQAKILWEQAYQYVFKSLPLRRCGFRNTQREIKLKKTMGVFRFLGGDSQTLDGLNPSVAIIDEYHSHKTDGVREVLESAMGSRLEPLIYIITTAGFNKQSVCKAYEDVCKQILKGQKEDDSTFIMIHEPAPDDNGDYNWESIGTWKMANPNLGISVNLDYLKSEYQKAINQPSKIPNFKTKHCNLWVDGISTWITEKNWNNCRVDEIPMEKFKEFGCYVGMDLSTTTDITAMVFLSNPDDDGVRYLKPFFYCPDDTIEHRSKEDQVPYKYWRDSGFLTSTPGNTVDYDVIKDDLARRYYQYSVERVELDQWNASQLANNLMELGFEVAYFSQQISNISFPTKQFEKLVLQNRIRHDGHPILAWMLSGCVLYQDANENIKVHKGHSHQGNKRVDGIIATIMALGGSMEIEDQSNKSSYTDDDDIEIFV